MSTLAARCEEHHGKLLTALLLAAAAWAWSNRFVLDDAFISFRYAQNLVDGHGLVWNPGERVEGYTNFLWTLLLAAPLAAGIDPVAFCHAAGPVLLVVTLWLTVRLGSSLLGSRPPALLAAGLLASSFTFSSFATGGLETQLLACFLTALFALAAPALAGAPLTTGRAAGLSCLGAAALMTRLDSGPVCAVPIVWLSWRVWQGRGADRTRVLLALVGPAALLVGVWWAWKLAFYGSLLPNTFAAKTGSAGALSRGLRFLGTFLLSTGLAPFPILIALGAPRVRREGRADLAATGLALAVAWLGIAAVGGDFMEFRFLVPTLPLLSLAIVWSIFRVVPWRAARVALLVLVLAGAVHHGLRFERSGGIESIPELAGHLTRPSTDWIGIGRRLADTLPPESDLRLAVIPAGAIPYFAGLDSLDMLGLTDPWIARHGLEIDALAGHTRVAPFARLVEQGVHLVVGLPWVRLRPDPGRDAYRYDELARLYLLDVTPKLLPEEASVVEVPLDSERRFVALYLAPHPDAEAAIARGDWVRFPLRRPSP